MNTTSEIVKVLLSLFVPRIELNLGCEGSGEDVLPGQPGGHLLPRPGLHPGLRRPGLPLLHRDDRPGVCDQDPAGGDGEADGRPDECGPRDDQSPDGVSPTCLCEIL